MSVSLVHLLRNQLSRLNAPGDLSRYFGGPVNLDTLSAASVEWHEKPGHLSAIQIDESKIPENDRIPRFTTASWCVSARMVKHF